jgi:hypothetical protein
MESVNFSRRGGSKANCHTIAGWRFTIARRAMMKAGLSRPNNTQPLPKDKVVDTECTQSGVIKLSRLLNIYSTDKDVREDAIA